MGSTFIKYSYRYCLYTILSLILVSCSAEVDSELYFIGDSMIHRWDTDRYFPEYITHDYGVDGSTIKECINRVNCNGNDVVILLGTNDMNISKHDETFYEERMHEYRLLIESTKAKTCYIVSILPRNDNKALNPAIETMNSRLKYILPTLQQNTVYVDAYSEMKKGDGIYRDYTYDGVHLSRVGYDILTHKVREAMK